MQPDTATRYWPTWGRSDWFIDDRYVSPYTLLARYSSREAVDGIPRLKVPRPEIGDPRVRDRVIAGSLFDALAAARLTYALDPRTPIGPDRQQIRHPAWLLGDGVGTCLDLATTYASMCLDHHLRPLLVVSKHHAIVAVALGADVSDTTVPGCVKVEESPGVLVVADRDAFAAEIGHHVVAIECTNATTRLDADGNPLPPTTFAEAERDGAEMVLRDETHIIDVAWLHEEHAHQVKPLAPPNDWLDVRLFLPGGVSQDKLFDSQQLLFDRLQGARGVHVIYAPSGQGKSTIARRLIAEAPFGAGWFLNASAPQVLVNSMAAAELAQGNRTGVGLSDVDRAGHADAARTRLRDARHPWVVAIDNADGEPGPIYRTLPQAKGAQLVVVTTTNEAWAQSPNVTVHNLEPLTEAEVLRKLDNPALVPLVGGRALLVKGFGQLANTLDVPTSELVVAALLAEDDELAGPIAYWSLVAERVIGEPERRVAQCAAYLPPDNVGVSALAALGLADGATAMLAGVGVLDLADGEEFARLHRLYGAAIRKQLADTEPPEARDAVISLVTRSPKTARVLGEFGDRDLLERLLDLLEDGNARTTPPDRDFGESFAAVGAMLELRNHVRRSAAAYERALGHLDADTPEDRAVAAACLHGIARPKYQHNEDEPALREALAQEERAHELMKLAGLERQAGKFLGLRGNIEAKLAKFAGDREAVVAALRAALDRIKEANKLRLDDEATPPEELARSEFNLAGPHVRLSQMEPDRAAEHLQEAEKVYRGVLAQRQAIYDADVHGHIAACVAGLGLVDYLRALIVASDPAERTRLLRGATSHTLESARHREALAGISDDADVGKSYRLLAKISAARFIGTQPAERRERLYGDLMVEVERELRETGDLLPQA